ncbi:MAG: hypothetical protein ABI867_06885 [Kofleriaceae bacterium]
MPPRSRTAELAWGGGPSTLKQGKAELLDVLRRAIADVREVPRIDLGQVS